METKEIILKILGIIIFSIGCVISNNSIKKHLLSHNQLPVPYIISNKANIFFFIGISLIVLSWG